MRIKQKKIGMVSLGCAKNQVDAEVMLGLLSQQGYEVVNQSQEADIIIINTCGFIGPAKEESVQAIFSPPYLFPNIPVPMRTMLEPSSIAISKSLLIPIDKYFISI